MTTPDPAEPRRTIAGIRFSRSEPWVAPVLFSLGGAIVIVAGLMISSWHTGERSPMAPALDAIQYDTAWVFAFCGIALALQATGFDVSQGNVD